MELGSGILQASQMKATNSVTLVQRKKVTVTAIVEDAPENWYKVLAIFTLLDINLT